MPGGQLAHQVPSGFNCASSWISVLPPPPSHKASPAGPIRVRKERHCLGTPSGNLVEQRQTSESLGLPFIFPGSAAVSGQGLSELTISKSLCRGKVQHCTALAQGSAVCSSCWFHVQTGRARGSGSCWRGHAHSQQAEEAQGMLVPPSQSTGVVGCGVLLCGCTIPAVTLVLDSDPLEPPVGGGWECWAHHWPTHSG